VSNDGGFALITGRLHSGERYKGHDELIDVWPQVLQRHPQARLVVAGDGDDRLRLEEKARRAGMQERIEFRGRVPDEELAGLYRDCSFFAMPSGKEGFGLVFLEAMSMGKACIAGRGAGDEVIDDGNTGIVVSAGNREELLAALLRLFGDERLRKRMGEAGLERYRERFTEEQFAARFLDVIRRMQA
jgi:glycosyltransferase involved in cell wall biosynthesis